MGYLVFDIETTPTSGIGKIPEPTTENPDPFPPLVASVPVVIGALRFDESYECRLSGVLSQRELTEVAMLSQFSEWAKDADGITWNGRGFDMPVIALRCLRYGIQLGWYYGGRGHRYRFSTEGHLDLMDYLGDHGAAKGTKLDDAAKLIGLPGKLDVRGGMVKDLWAAGKMEEVEDYCMADVVQTAFVWLRVQYMRGVIDIEWFRAAANSLLRKCHRNVRRYGELLDKTDLKILLLEDVIVPTKSDPVSEPEPSAE